MNVAIVAPTLSGNGGEETVIKEFLVSDILKKNNVNISLIILGKSLSNDWLDEIDSNVYITNTKNNFANIIIYEKLIKQLNIDIVLCLSRRLILFSFLLKNTFNKKLVVVSWIHFDLNHIKTRFMHLADYHFAISQSIANQLIALGIAKRSQIKLINNPVHRHSVKIRRTFNNSFLYIGRITFKGQKNLKKLIDLLANVKDINWNLDIYGDGNDKVKCIEYINNRYPELAQRFIWHGWVKQPWQYIEAADALILTSEYEGLPMVLLEAISRGLPCLSIKCSGAVDIIKSGINGEVFTGKNDFNSKLKKMTNTQYNDFQMENSIEMYYTDRYFIRISKILHSLK